MKVRSLFVLLVLMLTTVVAKAEPRYWMKIRAHNKYERTFLETNGISIEIVDRDYVIGIGPEKILRKVKASGRLLASFEMKTELFDFPRGDEAFHNYNELGSAMEKLAMDNRDIMKFDSIGKTYEGREILRLRISTQLSVANEKPGILFIGGHHAREHLSIEVPLMLAQFLADQYRKGQPEVVRLVETRDIHIIPMLNADGAEYDINTGSYKTWRKSRRKNSNGTYGVDLNRNYGYFWGAGGASKDPSSDVYMGEAPFSEPETQAVKVFLDRQENITMMLSYHTFSQLILYPWGYTYDPVSDERDLKTYKTMAETMAKWNGYTPQAAADLYIAAGDTVDYAYGQHRIFSFTFELDPKSIWDGGFYPGAKIIPQVFQKNIKPALYMIDLADNPYRAIQTSANRWGLNALSVD